MTRAVIIIPYFGKLPPWFQLFLNSCHSKLLDFIVITDDETSFDYPKHFKVIYSSFEKVQTSFYNTLNQNIYLGHPYKLCDYKPLYGVIFSDLLTNYAYWGYCDIDLLFGNIDKFVERYLELGYDKIFKYGHFTLYRNTREVNQLFTTEIPGHLNRFSNVSRTTYPCNFDEIGVHNIFTALNRKTVEPLTFENVNISYKNFAVGNGVPIDPELILFDNGRLYILTLENEKITRREIFYIHFMWRKNFTIYPATQKFLITDRGFIDFVEAFQYEYFQKYGRQVDDAEQRAYKKKLISKLRNDRLNNIKREIKTYKLNGIKNIVTRLFGIIK